MSFLYLTPASISYLTQFILSLAITVFLARRLRSKNKQLLLLTSFFTGATLFMGLLFLDATLSPFLRLLAVYAQNTALALALVFLLQFAYHFPRPYARRKWEARAALATSLAYLLWEALFMAYRYAMLLSKDTVLYRNLGLDSALVLILLWVPVAFLSQSIAADPRPVHWGKKIWNLQGKDARGALSFVFIFLILFVLGLVNVLRSLSLVSTSFYNITLSLGILVSLWLFASNYVNFIPEGVSVLAKLSILTLTLLLAILGSVGWIVAPFYVATYRPNLADYQTLRFTPDSSGGYTVVVADFHFESDLGDKLAVYPRDEARNRKINFPFPFYGQLYQEVYVSSSGSVSMGEPFWQPNMQVERINIPVIFPLLIELDTTTGGGVYANIEPDRLVLTWDHLPARYRPEAIFTFQAVLYQDGVIDITYNGLPSPVRFDPDATPSANPWVRGVSPGRGESLHSSNYHLLEPVASGQVAMIENYQLDFRRYLHEFILPMVWVVFGGSVMLLLGLPMILRVAIVKPLDALLLGVRKMDSGDLDVNVPIQSQDEIGFLTNAFNKMASRLNELVMDLEGRVSERTSELVAANKQLRKLSIAVEQSPSTIIITDTDAHIEYVNSSFTRSTGYTFDEVKGKNPNILKSGLTPHQTFKEMWSALLAGHTWRGEIINRTKDGKNFWEYTVIAPIYSPEGQVTHYVAIKEDITARILMEQALRESEEQYRSLFELESDAIFIIRNSDGKILEANNAAVELYGYTPEELLARRNTDLSAEPEATSKATASSVPANQVVRIPLRWHRKKDGIVFPVEITARFITWKGTSVHIAAIRDIAERRRTEQELERLAITDPLTGLFNRRHFFTEGELVFARANQTPFNLSALMIDFDHFKNVNDQYGHAAGDDTLRESARRMQANLRPRDIFGRYGGEEFAILLPRTNSTEACQIAERLRAIAAEEPIIVGEAKISITVSIGVAGLDKDTGTLEALLQRADEALYAAKQAGRNCWVAWRSPSASQ
ncbi:MAG: diguanylate cyclase [Chloroflexota bacterium]